MTIGAVGVTSPSSADQDGRRATTTDVDVLVVGAGLSGIDIACRLRQRCPRLTFAVLEARDDLGGTWDLFRYPGVRTDSDTATYTYPFHPWTGQGSLAAGADILAYLRETATTHGILVHIRFGHRVTRASWESSAARWRVRADTRTGDVELRARFLYLATGYFRYDQGHVVDFPGQAAFAGDIVHPQAWPENLEVAGRRAVVIGSGATAVTLAPALARLGAHVTILQRSPGYVVSLPSDDPLARALRRVLPARLARRAIRARNIALSIGSFALMRRFPDAARSVLTAGVARALPDGFDVATHFTPRYDPWDQRLCVVPDGDLFTAVAAGDVDIVTDTLASFTPGGIRLGSGRQLDADFVVTATGLDLLPVGGVALEVDGGPIELSDRYVYRGMMLSDVPNAAWCVGYTNASWTLRADLIARTTCRLLRYMGRNRFTTVVPRHDEGEVTPTPLLGLSSGYIERSAHLLPRQGRAAPWRIRQNYAWDLVTMRLDRFRDGRLEFTRSDGRPARPTRDVVP